MMKKFDILERILFVIISAVIVILCLTFIKGKPTALAKPNEDVMTTAKINTAKEEKETTNVDENTSTNVSAPAANGKTTTKISNQATAPDTGIKAVLNNAPLNPMKTNDAELDSMVSNVFSKIFTNNMTTYDKVIAIYDYLIQNMNYSQNAYGESYTKYQSSSDKTVVSFSRGLLTKHYGVCDHFAATFMVMTRRVGLNCYYEGGKLNGSGHAWNLMIINGKEYTFDSEADFRYTNGKSQSTFSYFGKTNYSKYSYSDKQGYISAFASFKTAPHLKVIVTVNPGTQYAVTKDVSNCIERNTPTSNFTVDLAKPTEISLPVTVPSDQYTTGNIPFQVVISEGYGSIKYEVGGSNGVDVSNWNNGAVYTRGTALLSSGRDRILVSVMDSTYERVSCYLNFQPTLAGSQSIEFENKLVSDVSSYANSKGLTSSEVSYGMVSPAPPFELELESNSSYELCMQQCKAYIDNNYYPDDYSKYNVCIIEKMDGDGSYCKALKIIIFK